MSLKTFAPLFADETKAIAFVESMMWPDGEPVCPHCETKGRSYRLQGVKDKKGEVRLGLWKCGACRKQFTVRHNSIFAESHIPLRNWLYAIHAMCSSKKGISANQLHRTLGLSYKAAWFLCFRVREAMRQEPLASMLGGPNRIVELDETMVGGKLRNNSIGGAQINSGNGPT